MTFGELAYLILVVAVFVTFSITLATVAHQTNRWSRARSVADETGRLQSLDKAA
jgi:hypothetical protein